MAYQLILADIRYCISVNPNRYPIFCPSQYYQYPISYSYFKVDPQYIGQSDQSDILVYQYVIPNDHLLINLATPSV